MLSEGDVREENSDASNQPREQSERKNWVRSKQKEVLSFYYFQHIKFTQDFSNSRSGSRVDQAAQ
jgi:hypothetical protein